MFQKTINLIISLFANFFLLFILFICIQNSDKKSTIRFLSFESAKIPVGLILGLSFFSGKTLANSVIILNSEYKSKLK